MEIVLWAKAITKKFGAFTALDQVSIEIRRGEVHAVLGENGAGKSTLVNLVCGLSKPTSGSIEFAPGIDASRVGMVHQHFMLVGSFNVEENIALAASTQSLENPVMRAKAMAESLRWDIPWQSRITDLPVGIQQRIEILKALNGDPEILILDEPTAVLSAAEVLDLFRVIENLRDAGKAIVLIAHKISEIVAIANRVTVLRLGKVVASAPIEATNPQQLVEWMVGEVPPTLERHVPKGGQIVLQVKDLCVRGDRNEIALNELSFDLLSGQIFGVGGVDGNGQIELAEAVVGVRAVDSGSILWPSGDPPKIAYIPPDRRRDGAALEMSILENMYVGLWQREKSPWARLSAKRSEAELWIGSFDVRFREMDDPIQTLSGGNMQKVILARSLGTGPNVVVAVNPTRGLDVRATQFVRSQLAEAASQGAAVLLISNDTDELAELAHQQHFLSRGTWAGADLAAALGS